MKVIYLNVLENKKAQVIDIAGELDEFYRLIKCDTIDITKRKIGENYYDIICDDEGLFAESPKISAINNLGEPMLVGNLIVCDANESTGELKSLTDEQVAEVTNCIHKLYTRLNPQGYYMITQCEY